MVDQVFTAIEGSSPPRKHYIAQDAEQTAPGQVRGWAWIVETLTEDGETVPVRDSWEEYFFEIMRYPPAGLSWCDEATGHPVRLDQLQPALDGVKASTDMTPVEVGLRSHLSS